MGTRLRLYFASDRRRAFQTALGLIWLLDGALQFQSFMYSNGFLESVNGVAAGQPQWLASTVDAGTDVARLNLTVFNTLFALVQVSIGLGLLYRRTVKPALALSFAWCLVVWAVSEGLGMLFAGSANALTGAPGAVLLYALIGLLVWPGERPGGLLGIRGARAAWGTLWLVMAWTWLLATNSSPNATTNAIRRAPGAGWLHSLQSNVASAAQGHGLVIALVLALVSAAIGVAVWKSWAPRPFLALAIELNLIFWVVGQGFGGIFYTGSATDPNAGPLFVLLSLVLYSLTRVPGSVPAPDVAARFAGAPAVPDDSGSTADADLGVRGLWGASSSSIVQVTNAIARRAWPARVAGKIGMINGSPALIPIGCDGERRRDCHHPRPE
jgi:hypothetical protein